MDALISDITYRDLQLHNYNVIQKLGEGIGGAVYLVERNGLQYAVKVYNYGYDPKKSNQFDDIRDIYYSMMAKHPYIVTYHEFFAGQKNFFLVMDIADMDLATYLKTKAISTNTKIKFIYQIGCALEYLRNGGIVHCDIKVDNILVKNENILLVDFGLAMEEEEIDAVCNPVSPNSPEVMQLEYHSYKLEPNLFLSNYFKLFDYDTMVKWNTNKRQNEVWIYGIISISIIYNIENILDENFLRENLEIFLSKIKYIDKDLKYSYFILIDLMAMYYMASMPIIDLIIDIFGKIDDELYPLLELICKTFLELNQSMRSHGYDDFLNNKFFVQRGYQVGGINNFVHYRNDDIILRSDVLNPTIIDTTTEWIISILNNNRFKAAPYTVLNTVDFFIQSVHKYTNSVDDIKLHAIACAYLILKISSRMPGLHDFSKLSHYNNKQIFDKILEVIIGERGYLKYESLCRALPNSGLMMQKAAKIMRNCENYKKLGGPSGAAIELIRAETDLERLHRIPRTSTLIDL